MITLQINLLFSSLVYSSGRVVVRLCVCCMSVGKTNTYLLHRQWHTYAILFHQHGAAAGNTVFWR